MIGKPPLVVGAGSLPKLRGDPLEPVRCKLVEGRLGAWCLIGRWRFRFPDAPVHIGEHMAERSFRFFSRPAFVKRAEGDVPALTVCPEADCPRAPVLGLHDATARFAGHQ